MKKIFFGIFFFFSPKTTFVKEEKKQKKKVRTMTDPSGSSHTSLRMKDDVKDDVHHSRS
jgi:hypothetical protein